MHICLLSLFIEGKLGSGNLDTFENKRHSQFLLSLSLRVVFFQSGAFTCILKLSLTYPSKWTNENICNDLYVPLILFNAGHNVG